MTEDAKKDEAPKAAAQPTMVSVARDLALEVGEAIEAAEAEAKSAEDEVAELTKQAHDPKRFLGALPAEETAERARIGSKIHAAMESAQHARAAVARLHKAQAGFTTAAQNLDEHAIFAAKVSK